jgi:hypothetical protein
MFQPTKANAAAVETKEMQMNPTLAKMLMDERIREITSSATRANGFGEHARHRNAFSRWGSTFPSSVVHRSGRSTSASSPECCPAV